jgi:hypothetical protein
MGIFAVFPLAIASKEVTTPSFTGEIGQHLPQIS